MHISELILTASLQGRELSLSLLRWEMGEDGAQIRARTGRGTRGGGVSPSLTALTAHLWAPAPRGHPALVTPAVAPSERGGTSPQPRRAAGNPSEPRHGEMDGWGAEATGSAAADEDALGGLGCAREVRHLPVALAVLSVRRSLLPRLGVLVPPGRSPNGGGRCPSPEEVPGRARQTLGHRSERWHRHRSL